MKQRYNKLILTWKNSTTGNKVIYILVFLLVPVVLIPLGILLIKKLKSGSMSGTQQNNTPKPIGTAEKTLKNLLSTGQYSKEFLTQIEKALRLETSHFNSGQWLKCGSAGMEASPRDNAKYPFGWGSLDKYAKAHGRSKDDFFIVTMKDNHTKAVTNYIGFKETGFFVEFMCYFLHTVRGGNVSAWNTLNKQGQASYQQKLNSINTKFIV